MISPIDRLSNSASVDAAAEAFFGLPRLERPKLFQSIATWHEPNSEDLITIAINEYGPQSSLDFFSLHLGRARTDAIVITGKILRDEPFLHYGLKNKPQWKQALTQWREVRWGLYENPWLLILTSGRDIDFNHPIFSSPVRPLFYTSEQGASRYLSDCPYPVITDSQPDIRSAIEHLHQEQQCSCVSIEAGPSTSRQLYTTPIMVDEVLLSIYQGPVLNPLARSKTFFSMNQLKQGYTVISRVSMQDESGPWTFCRLQRSKTMSRL